MMDGRTGGVRTRDPNIKSVVPFPRFVLYLCGCDDTNIFRYPPRSPTWGVDAVFFSMLYFPRCRSLCLIVNNQEQGKIWA